jgi:transposase
MAKGYRPYLHDHDLLLPPSLREWVAEEYLVYFVSDVVDQLDLSAIHAVYGEEKRGPAAIRSAPDDEVIGVGYCTGVFSSRWIQKRFQEDIPFKVLTAGNEPDFRTISDFRKIHIGRLQGLFEQVLEMALEVGTVKVGRLTVDGTKVKANASKHKAMSYGRMKEKQPQLREEVKQLLEQAEAADDEEDRRHCTSGATSYRRSCGGGKRDWPRSNGPRRWSSSEHGKKPRPRAKAPKRPSRLSRRTRINTTSPIRRRAL